MPFRKMYQADALKDLRAAKATYPGRFAEEVEQWLNWVRERVNKNDHSEFGTWEDILDSAEASDELTRPDPPAWRAFKDWVVAKCTGHPPPAFLAASKVFFLLGTVDVEVGVFFEVRPADNLLIFYHFIGLPGQGCGEAD